MNVLLNAGGWNARSAVAISDATVTEGDSGTVDAVFTVTRKGNLDGTVTVDYFTGDGDATAGRDYVAQSGTLTFGPGETTKTITIKVKGDLIDEYDQVFGVHLNVRPASTSRMAMAYAPSWTMTRPPPSRLPPRCPPRKATRARRR